MMNTIEQFEVLDTEILAEVEGGASKVSGGEVFNALAICTLAGGAIGSVFPVVGTVGGAVLGAQYCTGTWAIIRTH